MLVLWLCVRVKDRLKNTLICAMSNGKCSDRRNIIGNRKLTLVCVRNGVMLCGVVACACKI